MPRASAAAIQALSLVPTSGNVVPIEMARAARRRRERSAIKPSEDRIAAMLERVKRAKAEREQWRALIEQAYELFQPQRNPFHSYQPGQKKGADVLDSTAQLALSRWASRKQQALVPPGRKFARLVAGISTPEDMRDALAEPLDEQTDILFAHLAISNASTELHESMLDAGISTGAVMVLDSGDEDRPLLFQACPIDQLLIEEGPWGRVENVYRERSLPIATIMRQWPEFDFHPDTLRALEGVPPKPETPVDIIEACVFNAGSGLVDYCIVEVKHKRCGWYEQWEESPWIVYGASKLAGETYRRGPALVALAAARTLQRVKELELRNAALQIAGLWKAVPSGEFDPYNLTLSAGGIVPVTSMDDIEALDFNGNFDLSRLIVADLQQEIFQAMEAMNLGQIEETPVRTATEILVRDQQIAMDSASSSARLQTELVLQVVRKSVAVLARRGIMAPIRIDGKEVDVEFEGPLARAQKNEDVLNASQVLELLAPLGPAAMLSLKPEVLAKKIAEAKGLWPEAIRSDVEIRKLQEQALQVGAQMAEQQGVQMPGAGAA